LAVHGHAPRAERLEVDRRAERASDEPLDLERAAARTAGDALALAALRRAPREHRVLGGDPAGALAIEEARDAVGQRREAEHDRVAERDARRALRELRDADLDGHGTQRVGRAA